MDPALAIPSWDSSHRHDARGFGALGLHCAMKTSPVAREMAETAENPSALPAISLSAAERSTRRHSSRLAHDAPIAQRGLAKRRRIYYR